MLNKYIYWSLDLEYTKNDPVTATKGIMRHLLGQHKKDGQILYSFISESGQATFFRHIGAIHSIMKRSGNSKQLEQIFYHEFPKNIFS